VWSHVVLAVIIIRKVQRRLKIVVVW